MAKIRCNLNTVHSLVGRWILKTRSEYKPCAKTLCADHVNLVVVVQVVQGYTTFVMITKSFPFPEHVFWQVMVFI